MPIPDTCIDVLDDGIALVTVSGNLDGPGSFHLENALDTARNAHGGRIMLDLQGVTYLSSACLGVLLMAKLACKESGGDVVLINPDTSASKILRLLGLHEVFQVVGDIDTGRAAFH